MSPPSTQEPTEGEPAPGLAVAGDEQPTEAEVEPAAEAEAEVTHPPAVTDTDTPRQGPTEPARGLVATQIEQVVEDRVAPLGAVGGVGIGLVAGGVLASVASLLTASRVVYRVQSDLDFEISALPAGYAWASYTPSIIAGGVVGATIGVVMLTVDLTILARRRRARAIQLHFDVVGDHASMGIAGRF